MLVFQDDAKCEVSKIVPLVLPTQYSSDESESESERGEGKEDLKDRPGSLSPNVTLCPSLDQGGTKVNNDGQKVSILDLDKLECSPIGSCGPENVVSSEDDWIEKRWPKRVFYGEDGDLRHPYARMEKPNLNLMSCRYRCKSYRTFKCTARLDIMMSDVNPGVDERRAWGEHSELCKKKNGIKPNNYTETKEMTETKTKDVTEEFKSRLGEVAVDKIWMPPMKIWSMVRDEMVAADTNGMVTIPSSDVVCVYLELCISDFLCYFSIYLFHFL